MTTAGGIQSLASLLTDISSLEVPDFQRNYSWGDEQIDAFHKDALYAMTTGNQHFLGSTILMKKNLEPNDKAYQVIDGQQRFTTIFMYVAILRDLAFALPSQTITPTRDGGITVNVVAKANGLLFSNDETGEARFKSNYLLKQFLYEHIIREPSPNRPKIPARHKYFSLDLRKAHSRVSLLLKEELEKIESTEERLRFIWNLLKTISESFQILKITTTTYPESFDIFMTLNNRGLALGPSDLVKSLFMKFQAVGLSEDQIIDTNQSVSQEWKEATDNIDDGDPDQFLRHFLVATQPDSVQAKNIYSKIESIVTNPESDPKDESRKLLRTIVKKSSIYASLLKPNTLEDPYIRDHCIALHQLLDSYRILMLVVLDPEVELTTIQRRDLARITEILSVRWVLTGGNAQELEDHFQKVTNLFRDTNFNFDTARILLSSKIPMDENVRLHLSTETTKTSLVRVVLHKINRMIGDDSNLISMDPSKLHVEHIAPSSPTDSWKSILFPERNLEDVTSEYSAVVEMWGNKTILDKSINLSVKQKSFREKCNGASNGDWRGYRESPIAITRSLILESEWEAEIIRRRNRWIADSFLKIWSLKSEEDEVVPFHEWIE